jgi:hypothetical protein
VPDARRGLRHKKVAAGGRGKFQHRLVFELERVGEVDHHMCPGHDLFEPLAGDGVDTALRRGGDDPVAALARNRDGLRADQPVPPVTTIRFSSLVEDSRPFNGFECVCSDPRTGIDRTVPIQIAHFLFSTHAAAIKDHENSQALRMPAGMRRSLWTAEISFQP